MKRVYLILAVIPVLLIPWLGFTWLIFSIYILILYFEASLGKKYAGIHLNPKLKYSMAFVIFGMVLEILAVVDNLPKPPDERILLNPDPFRDLVLALGYYSGFAVVWAIVISKIEFSHTDIFLIGGTFGLLFEQTGKLLMSFQVFTWPYVFIVYGSFQAIPAVLSGRELENLERRKLGITGKIATGAITEAGCFITAAIFLHIISI